MGPEPGAGGPSVRRGAVGRPDADRGTRTLSDTATGGPGQRPREYRGQPSGAAGWGLEAFPGVSFNAVAEASPLTVLLPMGGAQSVFGIEAGDAFSWAKAEIFDPMGDIISGFASEIVKYASQAVAGVLSMLGWWVYKFSDGLLGLASDVSWRSIFPDPDVVKGLSPWYYFHKFLAMLWKAGSNAVEDAADWLWAAIGDALGVTGDTTTPVGGTVISGSPPGLDWLYGDRESGG